MKSSWKTRPPSGQTHANPDVEYLTRTSQKYNGLLDSPAFQRCMSLSNRGIAPPEPAGTTLMAILLTARVIEEAHYDLREAEACLDL